mgnify:CR=1 FL=1
MLCAPIGVTQTDNRLRKTSERVFCNVKNRIPVSKIGTLVLGGVSALLMITYAHPFVKAHKATLQDAPQIPVVEVDANSKKLEPFEEKIPGTVVKFKMIPIPGGKITVSDPTKGNAPKTVEVKPMWVGKTEVTWDEFDIFLFRLDLSDEDRKAGVEAKSRPSKPYGAPDRGFGHEGYPAIGLSFYTVQEYCKWLSAKTGKKFRLPTSTEWQYFATAGEKKAYPLANDDLDKIVRSAIEWEKKLRAHPWG